MPAEQKGCWKGLYGTQRKNYFSVKIFAGTYVGMAETVEETQSGGESKDYGEFQVNRTCSDAWINDIDLNKCSISPDEKQRLLLLLTSYQDVFIKSQHELGQATRFSHSIDTGTHPPFGLRPYRIPHSQLHMVDDHILFFFFFIFQ